MKDKGVLTLEKIAAAFGHSKENFEQPSQFIVNSNIDLKELNKPFPKKTPEEIERERVKYALEQVDLIQKMKTHFKEYEIKFYEEDGYFITAVTHGGKTVTNNYNFFDSYGYDLNTAIKDLLEEIE